MNATTQAPVRWFHLTPGRCVNGLLAIEGLLWAAEQFRCYPFGAHKGYAVLAVVAGLGLAMLLLFAWFAVAVLVRWRFQFSIRSLLALVVAVAMPCSWFAAEREGARKQCAAVNAIEALRE